MFICSLEITIILVDVRWRHQNVKKEVEYSVHEENWWRLFIWKNLHHLYLWCTQCEYKPIETIIEEYTKMFEARISTEATENCLAGKNHTRKQLHDLTTWKDILGKNVERYNELISRKVAYLHKVSSFYSDEHQFKKEELESVENSQFVMKYLYLTWNGRPDILWTVNKLTRVVK